MSVQRQDCGDIFGEIIFRAASLGPLLDSEEPEGAS